MRKRPSQALYNLRAELRRRDLEIDEMNLRLHAWGNSKNKTGYHNGHRLPEPVTRNKDLHQ